MIVQATNTGGDLGNNHFDIAMPGGGVGLFNACTEQYGAPANGWGDRYGGVHSRADCDGFPAKLKDGCYWRFDWYVLPSSSSCPLSWDEREKRGAGWLTMCAFFLSLQVQGRRQPGGYLQAGVLPGRDLEQERLLEVKRALGGLGALVAVWASLEEARGWG